MPWRNSLFANAVSSSVWAVSYGYIAYWAGREFEHSHRNVAIFLVIIALIVLIVAGIFVDRREAQLIPEAERAMPGSLSCRSLTQFEMPFGGKADIDRGRSDVRF
jgi:hypothetical protein